MKNFELKEQIELINENNSFLEAKIVFFQSYLFDNKPFHLFINDSGEITLRLI